LDSSRYVALIGALDGLVAQMPAAWPGRAREPAAEAVPGLVRRRYRRLRKAAAHLDPSSPAAELHRARIRAKQLRYSVEFVADLYGKPARRLVKRATALQDVLGAIQDMVVMDERLLGLGVAGHELPPASLVLAGQLAQQFAQRATAMREQVPRARRRVTGRAWKRLRRRLEAGREDDQLARDGRAWSSSAPSEMPSRVDGPLSSGEVSRGGSS
jgi:CHAD domain-containing protein